MDKARMILEEYKFIWQIKKLSSKDKNFILENYKTDMIKDGNKFLGETDELRFKVFNLPQGIIMY